MLTIRIKNKINVGLEIPQLTEVKRSCCSCWVQCLVLKKILTQPGFNTFFHTYRQELSVSIELPHTQWQTGQWLPLQVVVVLQRRKGEEDPPDRGWTRVWCHQVCDQYAVSSVSLSHAIWYVNLQALINLWSIIKTAPWKEEREIWCWLITSMHLLERVLVYFFFSFWRCLKNSC